jgi:uncharacterized protein YecE (DUF72 family)
MVPIWVGTSGWHYPHWRGPFYPQGFKNDRMLGFYAERFSAVEINNSFYRLPSEESFRRWRDTTPQEFRFAVKASRFITHMKRLKDPATAVERFLVSASGLGKKLSVILFQLPPRWGHNIPRLKTFLEMLPKQWRYAFEFRDPSWHKRDTYAVLERHGAAFCAFELAGQQSPKILTTTFAYIRLHGPGASKYGGRYSKRQLEAWFSYCNACLGKGATEVFVFFDNDEAGYAALNAQELKRMIAAR